MRLEHDGDTLIEKFILLADPISVPAASAAIPMALLMTPRPRPRNSSADFSTGSNTRIPELVPLLT